LPRDLIKCLAPCAGADVLVTCITKPDPNSRFEGIAHIGSRGWLWTVSQVIQSIRSRTNTFYTLVDGKRANLEVVDTPRPYLRTRADGLLNDNPLQLPRCGG
jgi:hypothetical protein